MISLKQFDNGFEYVELENALSKAKIALQGAHLFSYTTQSKPSIIWLSDKSEFKLGKAIRGGIPICWPWFGEHKEDATLPKHGFARTSLFGYEIIKDEKALSQIKFVLKHSKESLSLWPYKFELTVLFTLTDTLTVELTTKNCDDKEFTITQALHTYFQVSQVDKVSIMGLDNKLYFDSLLKKEFTQDNPLRIDKEVDRIYKEISNDIEIVDKKTSISIKTKGSNATVVWNPWIEKSKSMSDMTADGYQTMLCVETANVLDDFKTVHVNENVSLSMLIT